MADSQDSLFPDPRGEQGALPLDGGDAKPQSPLDVPQAFADASSFQVRDELEALVRRDLLGPWDGEAEEFRPGAMGPRERYLVGMLGPKQRAKSSQEPVNDVADLEDTVQGDAGEADLPEVLTPQSLGKMWASSMGLSFAVPADVDVLSVTAGWGRYGRRESQDEAGRKRTV
ncbi:MAG TPA: hypothetical protein VFC19_55005, partial [Candidatus Limnocylindrales bacterium]|nr:hypothetical protein [Candidatus Limnocylindrales bacterium]